MQQHNRVQLHTTNSEQRVSIYDENIQYEQKHISHCLMDKTLMIFYTKYFKKIANLGKVPYE